MEPPTMMDSGVQVTLDNESIGTTAKRMKVESAPTGKSVVVLKHSDVMIRNGIVFMPNTIEMAQLKKQGKGQFKTNVQFSSKMTEMDVKKLLVETFPFLETRRFYCAAAVDNRTRLDFHGQPRIWDGLLIRRKIKGNSALYILKDEDVGDGLDFKVSEQLTLKRSHDQITSPEYEVSEQSLRIGTETTNISKLLTSFEGATLGSSILTGASAEGSTVLGKSDKSQQQPPEKMSPVMQFYVPVTAQHGIMTPVLCSSVSATKDTKNGKDVAVALAPLSQSVPLVMVQGSAVQPGTIPKARISTASDQQSVSKAADGSSDARQVGFPLAVHKMPQVIPTIPTPQMNKLSISGGSPMQLQKTIFVEKTVRDQSAQTTECTDSSEVGLPVTTVQSDNHFQVELHKEGGAGPQHGARIVSSNLLSQSAGDQGEPSSAQAQEKGACGFSASERQPLVHLPVGMLVIDHEVGLSDSGVETSENIEEDASQSEQICLDVATERIRGKKVDHEEQHEFIWKGSDQGVNLALLGFAAEKVEQMTSEAIEKKSIVEEINPSAGPLKGGSPFLILFGEQLPRDIQSGVAVFGNIGSVQIIRFDDVNMIGRTPASSRAGPVTVKVHTSENEYLGETSFTYFHEDEELLRRFVGNRKLWPKFLNFLAQDLEGSEIKRKKTSQSLGFKEGYTEKPGNTKTFVKELVLLLELLPGKSDSFEDVTDNTENGGDYDADDEASFTDSSEDRDANSFNTNDDIDSNIVPTKTVNADLKKATEVQKYGLHGYFGGKSNLPPQFHQQTRLSTQHTGKPLTSQDSRSETYCQTGRGDTSDESSHLTEMMHLMVSQPEDVSVRDNLENLPPSRFHAQEGVEENPVVMNRGLNPIDVDENSISDKSRRAQYSRRMDDMDDSPAADL